MSADVTDPIDVSKAINALLIKYDATAGETVSDVVHRMTPGDRADFDRLPGSEKYRGIPIRRSASTIPDMRTKKAIGESGERLTRCRYVGRKSGNPCPNESVDLSGDLIGLCARHLYEAHQAFVELARRAGVPIGEKVGA